jgi:DnaJ-class molecular chaperone
MKASSNSRSQKSNTSRGKTSLVNIEFDLNELTLKSRKELDVLSKRTCIAIEDLVRTALESWMQKFHPEVSGSKIQEVTHAQR